MKTEIRRFSAFALIIILLNAFSCLPAGAQAINILRSQSQSISNSIGNQIQQVMRPKLQIANSAGPTAYLKRSADGQMLSIVSKDSVVRLWDVADGRQSKVLPIIAASSTGVFDIGVVPSTIPAKARGKTRTVLARVVAVGEANGTASLYDAVSGELIRQFSGHQGAIVAVRVGSDGRILATAGADGTIRLWETASGQQAGIVSTPGDGVSALAFANSGKILASAGVDGVVRLWAVPSGAVIATMPGSSKVTSLVFNGDSSVVTGDVEGMVRVWSAAGTAQASWQAESDPITGLDVSPLGAVVSAAHSDEVHVWNASGRSIATITDSDQKVDHSHFSPDGARVFTAGSSGLVKIWDATSGNFMAQMILTGNGWAVTDTTGRFDGSEGGLSNVSWAADEGVFNISNFSEPYFEPGLLAKTLRAPEAIITAAVPAVETVGVGVPPSVTLSVAVGAQAASLAPTTVVVTATDEGGGIDQVRVFHNSKAVDLARVIMDSGVGKTRTVTYSVPLLAGKNDFHAVATSKQHIEGKSETFTTRVSLPEPKPTLHLLVVGINQYANPDITLNYAVADARGFLDWAKKLAKTDFSAVNVVSIFDKSATRAAILERFRSFEKTKPEDVVVIYLAGHGENEGGSWYFLPTEFGQTMSHAAVAGQGVSSQMIKDGILKMGATRVLLLIDACKSGTLGKAFSADADRKDLQTVSRSAGIHVMMATEKEQLAVELADLGHGAFTYTVLNALAGASTTEPVVHAKKVLAYTLETVPVIAYKYTQMEQRPTVYSRGSDFELGHKSN